jgi:hypothetical protein
MLDATTDLEQVQPQRIQLHASDAHRRKPATHRVQEPVVSRVEHEPELVGPEAVVAQPIGEARGFQILDPVLPLAACGIAGIQRLWRVGPRRDDEAGVRPLG